MNRTNLAIRRSRLEYAALLERLEQRAIMVPDGNNEIEELSPPPSPSILDESLNTSDAKLTRNGLTRKTARKTKSGPGLTNGNSSARVQRIRDPDLPKRPTNAYLIFCEVEKEKIKQDLDKDSCGSGTELSKALIESWKSLNDEERRPYYKLYEDDRERYQKEMSAYNQRKQMGSEGREHSAAKAPKRSKTDDTSSREGELVPDNEYDENRKELGQIGNKDMLNSDYEVPRSEKSDHEEHLSIQTQEN